MKFFASVLFVSTICLYTQTVSSRSAIAGRIIGGTVARAGEFPFAAAVNIQAEQGQYFCGGSLVSRQFILTAAQCCEDALRFTIVLGTNNVQENPPEKITVAAEEYTLHPDYDAFTLQNDICIIKLRMPTEYNDYVSPITLPNEEVADYTTVVAIGWGQISDEDPARVSDLNRVTITTLSNEECRLTYGNSIIDQMVCAEGNYNEGSCLGDSGSPLVQYVLNQAPTQVGIASFNSGNGCESTDPSGFTRTYPYTDWIKNVTGIS